MTALLRCDRREFFGACAAITAGGVTSLALATPGPPPPSAPERVRFTLHLARDFSCCDLYFWDADEPTFLPLKQLEGALRLTPGTLRPPGTLDQRTWRHGFFGPVTRQQLMEAHPIGWCYTVHLPDATYFTFNNIYPWAIVEQLMTLPPRHIWWTQPPFIHPPAQIRFEY